MFLGHFALALGAKRIAPRTSLGTLVLSAQLLDLLWPVFLLVGLERVRVVPGLMAASALDFVHYPISHSLLTAVGWAALAGGVSWVARRSAPAALVVAGLVASHWFLDAPMHRPDLPLWPGSGVRVGGGLWDSIPLSLTLELGFFALGVWVYLRSTRASDAVGRWALAAMAGFLVVSYVGATFGPPPPSARAVAVTTLTLWLFVPWAHWVERHRTPRSGTVGQPPASGPAPAAEAREGVR